ncbi:hypothetical protein CcCBS67573_g04589 [Chytriomyces confervae]|uniref:G-protein coupled receptors family 3 profile domain-containing protein n=1 Tax=Chytriomyces confervae TaxID=246404 RepID=A0A507FEZ0_9FUNG|nr:hypothetical protein CcCBS67573_g04589 [Chytriomyces confervae]
MVLAILAALACCWPAAADTNITLGMISNYCAIKNTVFTRSLVTNFSTRFDANVISTEGNSGWSYYADLAVVTAIERINNDPSILPGVHVNLKRFTDCGEYYPSADLEYSGKSGGYASAVTATDIMDVHKDVIGVVGNEFSMTAKGIAEILSNAQIPYCAASTAAPRYTNKNMYPYFFRASSYSVTESLLSLMLYWDVKRVAIIYQRDDEFGYSGWRRMKQAAADHQIDIVSSVGLSSNFDDQAIRMMNETLHRSDARYIIVVGQAYFVTELLQCRASLLLDGHKYVWLLNNGFTPNANLDVADLQGLVLANHCTDLASLERGENLRSLMNQNAGANFSTSFFYGVSAELMYDCTVLMLAGFDKLQVAPEILSNRLAQDDMNLTLFRNLDIAGSVSVDKLVLNEQGDGESPVCFYTVTDSVDGVEFARTDNSRAKIISFDKTIPIFSGSSIVPSDGSVRIFKFRYSLQTQEGTAIVCLSIIGILTSSAGALFLFKFQRASIVRASCLPEMLVICFGAACAYLSLLLVLDTPSSAACNARALLLLVGYSAILVPLASKNLMMRWIFGQESSRTLEAIRKAKTTFRMSAIAAVVVHVSVCVLALMDAKVVSLQVVDGSEAYVRCAVRGALVAPTCIWYVSNALVWISLVVSAMLSTKVKLVEYNETTQMVLVALFSAMNIVLIAAMESAPDKLTDFKICLILWITTTAVLGTMLGGRVVDVMQSHVRIKHDNEASADDSYMRKSTKQTQLSFSRRKTMQFYSFRVLDKAGKLCVFKIQRYGIGWIFDKWMTGIISLHSLGDKRWICITTLQKAYCTVIRDPSKVSIASSCIEIKGTLQILVEFEVTEIAEVFMGDIGNAFKEIENVTGSLYRPEIVVN